MTGRGGVWVPERGEGFEAGGGGGEGSERQVGGGEIVGGGEGWG